MNASSGWSKAALLIIRACPTSRGATSRCMPSQRPSSAASACEAAPVVRYLPGGGGASVMP
jgi:hypothetical protein